MRRLTLTALMGMRRGTFELWKDTALGPRLVALWTGASEREAGGESDSLAGPAQGDDARPRGCPRRKHAIEQFDVAVFHGENPYDDDDSDDVPAYNLNYSAMRLGSATVSARDEREAAARAWIQLAGEARVERLKELNAPAHCIAHETDVRAIAAELRESGFSRAGLELYNGCEVWFFCITSPAGDE
jgi:hypothetical protein